MKPLQLFFTGFMICYALQLNAQISPQITPKQLIGSWYCSSENWNLEYREGGVAVFNGAQIQYSLLCSNIIQYTYNEQKSFWQIVLSGNTLTFYGQLSMYVYQRASSGNTSGSGGTNSMGSSNGSEIAGEWRYADFSSASTGSGNYMETLTLNPNGTFTFSSSNDMSVQGYDQYGDQTFSAGSSSDPNERRGTWSFNGSTIVFNGQAMSCQKTYCKNTHELALQINGKVYCTTTLRSKQW